MKANTVKTVTEKVIRMSVIVIMAVLFVVLFFLFVNGFDSYSDAGFIYSFANKAERIFLVGFALLFFGFLFHIVGLFLKKCTQKSIKCINLGMWIVFIMIQAFFLFYIRSYYKWDSGFVIGAAASLAEQNSVAEEAYYYLSVYPNQNLFVFLTAVLVHLANFFNIPVADRPLLFNTFNTILMDLSLILLISILKKFHKESLFGKKIRSEQEREALLCRMRFLLFCNPFLYLGVSYYYTITLSWIFTMGFLVLLFDEKETAEKERKIKESIAVTGEEIRDERREKIRIETRKETGKETRAEIGEEKTKKIQTIIKWVIAGLLLGIGYELRATAIIFAIAALILVIFCLLTGVKEKKRLAVKTIIITLAAVLSSQFIHSSVENFVGIDTTNTAFPTTHWIMMSLTPPGGHNAEDEEFTASFATKEEKKAAVSERMREKLQTMGIKGYAELVLIKVKRTFGDGMNGYTTFLSDGYKTGKLYDALFGNHKDLFILWHQGYYLFLMLGILISVVGMLKAGCNKDVFHVSQYRELFYFLLVLLGAILFYVLWEASEQYSVPFMPIMLFLGLSGMQMKEDGCFGKADMQKKEDGCIGQFAIQMEDDGFIKKENNILFGQSKQENVFRNRNRCLWILGLSAAFGFAAWSICRYSVFVNHPFHQSQTVATQILANEPFWVDDGETLIQNLTLDGSCNHLVIQWRNPLGEENDSVYEIVFGSRDGTEIYFKEQIVAAQSGYNGAGIYDFETVTPNKEAVISIQKVAGSPDSDLQFVRYHMYGYTPYPGGSLEIVKDSETTKTDSSLLFLLSNETEKSYATPTGYIFFVTCLFLIFLFMGICCKLEVMGFFQNE
ncbi:MAG: hypothetical protein ACI4DK_15560 [Lachnospiraceae bacterium]